jgi:hypothetical protein
MTNVEVTVTTVLDVFPALRKVYLRRFLTTTSICIIYYLLGFIFTTNSGTYWIGNKTINLIYFKFI